MDWNTACPDWETRIVEKRSLVPDLPLFPEERDKALRVFNRLRMPDVIGQPTMEEAAGDWFRDIVAALFGSYDVKTHTRMIQEVFLLVPKKNSKTSGSAAIMVTAMIVNRRPHAEFLLIAPTMTVAGFAYSQAVGIIKADPELLKLFHLRDHKKEIEHRGTHATLKILAADTDVVTGSKAAGVLVDETHEFAKKSNAAAIFVEIRGGMAARPDGFLIQITTQSKKPPVGVFKSELALARKIRDGLIQLARPRLAVLYELPKRLSKNGGWKNRATWSMVNPNHGRSVDEAFLETQLQAAEESGAEALTLLASQHFNVEVGLAQAEDRWRGADFWLGAVDKKLTLDELLERSEVVVAGIDGGGLDDLLGLAILGRCKTTKRWLLWSAAWCHPEVYELRKDIVSQLEDFRKEGTLTLCETPTEDIEQVVEILVRVRDAGLFPEEGAVGLDPAGVAAIVDELASHNMVYPQVAAVPQGYRLNGAVHGSERKLKSKTLIHGGSALMTWCVGNAKAVQRGNAIHIEKETSGKAKIDPLMAMFDAVVLMSRNPEPSGGPSVYETRGVRVV